MIFPFSEPLEPRRLLAGDFVFATLNKAGTLTLVGTPQADHYVIRIAGGNYAVDRDGQKLEFRLGAVNRVRFDGGAGDDLVDAEIMGNGVKLIGGEGNDTLIGGSFRDSLEGGVGADVLTGNGHEDTLMGNGGQDCLHGMGGDDFLSGGAGDDWLNGGSAEDRIDGGRGNDTLTSVGGDDLVFGGAGTDTGIDLDGLTTPPDGVENLI